MAKTSEMRKQLVKQDADLLVRGKAVLDALKTKAGMSRNKADKEYRLLNVEMLDILWQSLNGSMTRRIEAVIDKKTRLMRWGIYLLVLLNIEKFLSDDALKYINALNPFVGG